MKLTITHNGFHGYQTHTVRGTMTLAQGWSRGCGVPEGETVEGYQVEITESGAKKFACGAAGCKCGEGLAASFWVSRDKVSGSEISVNGNYPQGQ